MGIVSWGMSSAVPGGGYVVFASKIIIINVDTYNYSVFRCGNDRYGVFTEVGKYMDWITSHFDLQPPDEL